MTIRELPADELDSEAFIAQKVEEIAGMVGDGIAINALSGGVDSSTVTMLAHRALGDRLKTYFIDNGLMRQDEPHRVVALFRELGVPVELVDAEAQFFRALQGVTDPEDKREAITQTFYRDVFGELVRSTGAKYLLHGTILTDVDETQAGIKRQHNIFEQIGIDPEEAFGYKIKPETVPRPGAGRTDHRRSHARTGRAGENRDGHYRRRVAGHRRIPVHGHSAPRPRDGDARWQAGVRAANRGALLEQRGRENRNPDARTVRRPGTPRHAPHRRRARGRERHVQHHRKAAIDDGSGVTA
jgi:hypothetical protein